MTELQLWANKRVEEHRAKQRVRVPPKVIARPKSSSDPSITYRVLQYADGRKECCIQSILKTDNNLTNLCFFC